MILIYANEKKLDLNRFSPISLLLGASFTWSCCLKVVEQMEQEAMELMELTGIVRNKQ